MKKIEGRFHGARDHGSRNLQEVFGETAGQTQQERIQVSVVVPWYEMKDYIGRKFSLTIEDA